LRSGHGPDCAWRSLAVKRHRRFLNAGHSATLDLHHNNAGSPHISLYVHDVEAKYAELQRRDDVKITSGLVQIARNMDSL
jgi:hypothetical protein